MSATVALAIASGLGVAGANGANDNAKGVATLVGGGVFTRRKALWFGHLATFAGAIAAIWVSRGLIRTFQGGGFLPAGLAGSSQVLWVVGAAAAATVLLATILRLPISTTHALTGSLVGVSVGVVGSVPAGPLMTKFLIPLVASPLLSAVAAGCLCLLGRRVGTALGLDVASCLCIESAPAAAPVSASVGTGPSSISTDGRGLAITTGTVDDCAPPRGRAILGVTLADAINGLHVVSAGTVSLARGLNDAPKLAALFVGLTAWWTAGPALMAAALAMFLGGWLGARRIVGTMAERITEMNVASAAAANVVASCLVILASFRAMPVSTTHVTCGALFGIGVAQRRAHWGSIRNILLAWVVTLPLSAGIAVALTQIPLE